MKENILIVDDEPDIRDVISVILNDEGYNTNCVSNAQEAQAKINIEIPSLIILDIWMRDITMDGLSLLNWIKDSNPEIPVLMISGHGTVEIAVNAIKAGAYDFIEKPFKSEKLLFMVSRALENSELKKENEELKQQVRRTDMIVGKSSIINSVRQTIAKVSQTNSRVLILGSSGSGKEACARTIHQESPRRNSSFVHVNCSMVTEEELFGKEFRLDNNKRRLGLFEKSNRGTLYFDEICDLSLELQGKIIHAIQQQRFKRIGGNFELSVDVRVISSSSKNIKEQIELGMLREDLYYRLNVFPLLTKTLSERIDDIIPITTNLLTRHISEICQIPYIEQTAVKTLLEYKWPGNVRELENVIQRALVLCSNSKISELDIIVDSETNKVSVQENLREQILSKASLEEGVSNV